MSGTSFTKKVISLTFTLNSGTFEGTTANALTVSGLRTTVAYSQQGWLVKDAANIVVYGLTQSQMSQLSTYGAPPTITTQNMISVSAGDNVTGMSVVFQGAITEARAKYTGENAPFIITAVQFMPQAVQTVAALSYNGPVSVAVIMGNLAQQLGLTLENSGVTSILTNFYQTGSLLDQAKAVAKAANINALIDSRNGLLAIWPLNQARNGQTVLISPTSGLVGYPEFTLNGVMFECLWNPNIVYGKPLQLQSSLKNATGTWVPVMIDTNLSSEDTGGPWFQRVTAYAPGFFQAQ